MSDMAAHGPFPRGALVGASLLVGLALLSAGVARLTGVGTVSNPESHAVERHALRFEDRDDGAVLVRSADAGLLVEVLEPGTHGFARGVLRGLARERRARGIDASPAFHLTRWADGRLTLEDPSTGRSVELGVFGPTNAQAFASLLAASRDVQ